MRVGQWLVWSVCACGLSCSPVEHSSSNVGAGGQASMTGTLSPCTPLAPSTTSVELDASSILAAGRSADGTVYVMTEQQSQLRLFVTDGDALVERFEQGTGQDLGGSTKTWLFDYVLADGSPVSVEVQQEAAIARMGVLKGPKPGKTWSVGSVGETLTLLANADAAALKTTSTQTFFVDYAGVRSDGNALVLIAPEHARDYSGERLFWGMPSALSERTITSFSRGLSIGGSTLVTFELGASSANLVYSFPFDGQDAGTSSQGSLTVDGQASALLGSAPPALPDSAQFLCR